MRRLIPVVVSILAFSLLGGVAFLEVRHQLGNRKADRLFAQLEVQPLDDIGATGTLRILPLMEYHSASQELLTEVGISHLVETDDHRILYDVGHNPRGADHSPLERNLETLGIDLATLD